MLLIMCKDIKEEIDQRSLEGVGRKEGEREKIPETRLR